MLLFAYGKSCWQFSVCEQLTVCCWFELDERFIVMASNLENYAFEFRKCFFFVIGTSILSQK